MKKIDGRGKNGMPASEGARSGLRRITLPNRKAVLSEFLEEAIVLIGFFVVILFAIIFVGATQIKVRGEVEAENAKFTCKQDVTTFLKYDATPGVPFDELLVQSYGADDYAAFAERTEELFDLLLGPGKWQVTIADAKEKLVEVGDVVGRDKETCGAYIPVPCHVLQPCRLGVNLELAY